MREEPPAEGQTDVMYPALAGPGPRRRLRPGPGAARVAERGIRQDRVQRTEAAFDALPFDTTAARAYGRVYSPMTSRVRKARGARAVDLLIAAATAVAADLPLYTRNTDDFQGLEEVVTVASV